VEKLFGSEIYKKMMELKLTLVGGGTTGIEVGKTLALMGIGS
jgi:molybdopterin/thiamine biosynthesis adenylyltransferase